jgi:hypothetical protein
LLPRVQRLDRSQPAQYEGGTRVPATISAIADGIRWAEMINGGD